MTYKEVLDYWLKIKPIRIGKTLWLMIAEAIEKQIPKKPTHTYKRCGFIVEGCCPICNRSVFPEDKGCPHCLQAIDWSEE